MSYNLDRRRLLTLAAAAATAGLAGCTSNSGSGGSDAPGGREPGHSVEFATGESPTLLPEADTDLAVTGALFERASAVVVAATEAEVPAAAKVAEGLGIPLLRDGPALGAELDRLGARTVVVAGPQPTGLGDREFVTAQANGTPPDLPGLPSEKPAAGSGILLTGNAASLTPATVSNLAVAGFATVTMTTGDPRVEEDARRALRAAPEARVLGIGSQLGTAEVFSQRVRTATVAAELPGGGISPFPGRNMIALYGHPTTPALGMLGEQGPAAAVARAKKLTAEYQALLPDRNFVPAFEIIATIASAAPEPDQSYSRPSPIPELLPLIEAAEQAEIYCVLDLQPGRTDFLTQAKAYEELLRRPWVGLALDPEWRLRPGEKHLVQIGHVGIDEVNEVGRWLDQLVADHDLPPKVLTLHQFQLAMIRDRERLDVSLDNIQWLVHVDGSGGQGAKQDTWNTIRAGLPETVHLGWKNFEDEDAPMLTVAQTVAQVEPFPSFISYQ